MNRVSVGAALVLMTLLGNAISDGYLRGGDPAHQQGANQVLLAGSGDNPWAVPDPRREGGKLPSYITNPKYATEEDVETKLNYGKKDRNSSKALPQQPQPAYGAPLGLPAVPHIYAPYYGAPYGYPAYPGMGTPYTGDGTGFGGNPLITPYGNIYGNTVPYPGTQPPTSDE